MTKTSLHSIWMLLNCKRTCKFVCKCSNPYCVVICGNLLYHADHVVCGFSYNMQKSVNIYIALQLGIYGMSLINTMERVRFNLHKYWILNDYLILALNVNCGILYDNILSCYRLHMNFNRHSLLTHASQGQGPAVIVRELPTKTISLTSIYVLRLQLNQNKKSIQEKHSCLLTL